MIRTVEPDDMATFDDQKDNPVASDMAAFAVRDRPAHEAHWAKILANHAVIARTIVQGDLVVGNIVSFLADGCAKYRLLDRSSVLGPRIRHSGSDRIHRRGDHATHYTLASPRTTLAASPSSLNPWDSREDTAASEHQPVIGGELAAGERQPSAASYDGGVAFDPVP